MTVHHECSHVVFVDFALANPQNCQAFVTILLLESDEPRDLNLAAAARSSPKIE